MIVAAHQPNFFPWLGFFDKVVKSDLFVLLDNVQFPKSGTGTWTNRVKMLKGRKPGWITMPVVRSFSGTRLINQMQIDNSLNWREKVIKTIEQTYHRHPCFAPEWDMIRDLIQYDSDNLCLFNIHAIKAIAGRLGIDVDKFILASSLEAEGKGGDLLIALTRAAGGDTYLSGDGAQGYLKNYDIIGTSIALAYQRFAHPVYPQCGREFAPGMSTLDAIFSIGAEKVCGLLPSGEPGRPCETR